MTERTPAQDENGGPEGRSRAWLSGAGLRPTRQRLALARLLVGDGRNRHVTAESLHDAARASDVPVSLATIYNTLRAFSEAGLLREITVDGTKSYFDTNVTDHPHFYWEDSATLTDASAEECGNAGETDGADTEGGSDSADDTAGDTAADGGSSSSAGQDTALDDDGGCSCTTSNEGGPGVLLFSLFGLAALRRRR